MNGACITTEDVMWQALSIYVRHYHHPRAEAARITTIMIHGYSIFRASVRAETVFELRSAEASLFAVSFGINNAMNCILSIQRTRSIILSFKTVHVVMLLEEALTCPLDSISPWQPVSVRLTSNVSRSF